MKVKELKERLEKFNEESEVYMFYKTKDNNLSFTSDIQRVDNGAVVDQYGNLQEGVLISRD